MVTYVKLNRALAASAAVFVMAFAAPAFAQTPGMSHGSNPGLSPNDDMSAPANNPRLMPNAPLGSEYPSHGNVQAGEMNLNPTDPRAQLVNGLPNNTQSGGYGSPLAGNKANVPQ